MAPAQTHFYVTNKQALRMIKDRLHQMKWRMACEVISRFSVANIRTHSLGNLARWRAQGTWSLAYDEWLHILNTADDQQLHAVIVGTDEKSRQLRQSMPYVGMLDQNSVRRLHAEWASQATSVAPISTSVSSGNCRGTDSTCVPPGTKGPLT